MYIAPIKMTNLNDTPRYNKPKPLFKAHPDFYKFNSTQSCFFRRGMVILSNEKGYAQIEDIFYKLFAKNSDIKQILIAGIGHSQEPFSYLSTIKGILGSRQLKQNVDLYTVDLQSVPDRKTLKSCALSDLLEYEKFPFFAEKGFMLDSRKKWLCQDEPEEKMPPVYYLLKGYSPEKEVLEYRVNDEIFNFLETTYKNPQKSKWDSRIQEVITGYPDAKFDVVSANNILPYIQPYKDIIKTVREIERTLKPNGYFIIEPYEISCLEDAGIQDKFSKVYSGIFRKK